MNVSTPRPTRRRRSHGPRPQQQAQPQTPDASSLEVLRNRPFLLLWLAQVFTQVGGNMVIYGMTVLLQEAYHSYSAISGLLLCFLVPAIILSAPAGVLVDQVDKRLMLVVTNVIRGVAFVAIFFVGTNLPLIYLLVLIVATTTTFFGPAEASMIPTVVPREQLLAANGFYTLTMNAAFAAGFALFGPFVVAFSNPQILVLLVAACYFIAAGFCWTLPPVPPVGEEGVSAGKAVADAERAVGAMIGDLNEGLRYIRDHREIGWSLSYLGITGALIGVLGTLGPGFAEKALGLAPQNFIYVVLPLGLGIVTGILSLNAFGRYLPRRRVIETGMICLGILLAILSVVGPISKFLEGRASANGLADVSRILSLLSLVIGIAFLAGVAYSIVAIAAQTQLQEDVPEDVRGRIFGVLNMLVSIASLLPIIIVGPIAEAVGSPPVILACAALIGLWGVASVIRRGPLQPVESAAHALLQAVATVDPVSVAMAPGELVGHGHVGHASARTGVPVAHRLATALPAEGDEARGRDRGRAAAKAAGTVEGAEVRPASEVPAVPDAPAAPEPKPGLAQAPSDAPESRPASPAPAPPVAGARAAADEPAVENRPASPDPSAETQAHSHVPAAPVEPASASSAPATPVADSSRPPEPLDGATHHRFIHRGGRPRGVVRTPLVEGSGGSSIGAELRRLRAMFRRGRKDGNE